MVKTLLLLMIPLPLLGCSFAQGFSREAANQLADIAAGEIERRLGDDFAQVSDALKEVPSHVPGPTETGGSAALGALLAIVLGGVGKGMLAKRRKRGEEG